MTTTTQDAPPSRDYLRGRADALQDVINVVGLLPSRYSMIRDLKLGLAADRADVLLELDHMDALVESAPLAVGDRVRVEQGATFRHGGADVVDPDFADRAKAGVVKSLYANGDVEVRLDEPMTAGLTSGWASPQFVHRIAA